MIRRNFLRLLDKYINGTASPEERALLEAWFDALPAAPSFVDTLTDEQRKQLEVELFASICRRIEELRYHRFELFHQATGDLGFNSDLFREKYIELIRHPPIRQTPVHPFLLPDDVCFKPMLQYLSLKHRQTLAWAQLDKLPIQQLAVKLRLTTSGARSCLLRAQEKLTALVHRCCIYQYDTTGRILSCIIRTAPGCCASATPIIQ